MQEPQQQQQRQQPPPSRYIDNDCSRSSRPSFVPSEKETSALRSRSLQCTLRAVTDRSSSSRSPRCNQLISSRTIGPAAPANPAESVSATSANAAVAKTIADTQSDKAVVRLSLDSLGCFPMPKSSSIACSEADDALKQEGLQRKHREKNLPLQHQTEPKTRNSFVQSLKAGADAYRYHQQQHQHQDGLPLTEGEYFQNSDF